MPNSTDFDNLHNPEAFKDDTYHQAVRDYPHGVLVYILTTGQLQMVEEVRASPDGPRIKVAGVGSVPINELRIATDTDIENSKIAANVNKVGAFYYFKT